MQPRFLLSFANFFGAGYFFLFLYIVGPYLATHVSETIVGLISAAGALATLVLFPFMPRLVSFVGPKRLVLLFSLLSGITLLLLSFVNHPIVAIALMILLLAVPPFVAYQMDLLLEANAGSETRTGRIRTFFLTAGNIALVLSPFAGGLLLGDTNEYGRVFLAAALLIVPFLLILALGKYREGEDPHPGRIKDTLSCMLQGPDTRAILAVMATLQFAYALLPLYIPLYLHIGLGMPWSELGWVLSVMLLPFIVVEYPIGWLADKKVGDKKILFVAFLLGGVTTGLIALIGVSTPLFLILAILVGTRLGFATVEAVTESHFFRHVSERDENSITVFRMIRPFFSLLAPLVGTALFFLGGYETLFVVSGVLIALGGAAGALFLRRTN